MNSDILIVDDEEDIRDLVSAILDDEGYETRVAYDSDSAFYAIMERLPKLVFLDIWLQGSRLDGLALLDRIKSLYPQLPIVMISGHGNIETAVSAIRQGAYDFIEKPFKADRLIFVAERALENSSLKRTISELKIRGNYYDKIIGKSLPMLQLQQTIARVAPTNSRVMVIGPPGSGKELVARSIHLASARRDQSFLVLNAASITPEHMETELFGIEYRGEEGKIGALEEAHGGTLYIDEIADMPPETQNKIFRVLVDQTFERVGGTQKVKVDVRIISSTAKNLKVLIEQGSFRQDLYHRLAVVPITIPSLAERPEDIPSLVSYFMQKIFSQNGIRPRSILEESMIILQSHDWPGNVRQLYNNIERLMILLRDEPPEKPISVDLLPEEIVKFAPRLPTKSDIHVMSLPLREAREMFERHYLIAQINRFGGNVSKTAEFIDMERSALHRKLKSLGIQDIE